MKSLFLGDSDYREVYLRTPFQDSENFREPQFSGKLELICLMPLVTVNDTSAFSYPGVPNKNLFT